PASAFTFELRYEFFPATSRRTIRLSASPIPLGRTSTRSAPARLDVFLAIFRIDRPAPEELRYLAALIDSCRSSSSRWAAAPPCERAVQMLTCSGHRDVQ